MTTKKCSIWGRDKAMGAPFGATVTAKFNRPKLGVHSIDKIDQFIYTIAMKISILNTKCEVSIYGANNDHHS